VQRHCSSSWGSIFVLWATTFEFVVANNGTLQQAPARSCSSGWDRDHPLPSSPPLHFSCSRRYSISLLIECTTYGMEVRSRACPGEVEEAAASLAGQVLSMTPAAKYLQFLASGGPVCWAMRASSDHTAGGSRSGGSTRRTAPSIPTRLASWVLLCLYMAQ
jgi:hypothetical protein